MGVTIDKLHNDVMEDIEVNLIDKHGISFVLNTIQQICYAKGEHLRSNWQDDETGNMWDVLADRLMSAVELADVM